MDERYGTDVSQEVDDATWIRDASARGECLLTKDVWIARRPAEAQQVVMSEARVFALKNARLTGEAMAGLFVLHGPSIVRWATRVSGPFVCGVGPRGLARVRLTWP